MLFSELASFMERIEKISERSTKINLLSSLFRNLDSEEIKYTVWLLLGNIGEEWKERELFVSINTIIDVLEQLGINRKDILNLYKKLGDPAEAIKIILENKKINQKIFFKKEYSIKDIFNSLKYLENIKGENSRNKKINFLKGIYINLSPLEGKLLTRILQGDMRYGIGEGIIEEALSNSFNINLEEFQRAHMILGDLGILAERLKIYGRDYIKNIKIELFNPIKPMLAEKAKDINECIQTFGKAAYEFKFDGIRAQIHKNDKGEIRIFTRRLKDVTQSFPDVVKNILDNIKERNFVIEGEIVAWNYKTNKPLPFQILVRRIKREKEREKYIKLIKTRIFLFDILYLNDEMLIDKPYIERRKILEKIKGNLDLTPMIISDKYEEIKNFFQESIKQGNEGLVGKDLNSKYIPGKRGKHWLKLKSTLEPLDLIIIGAEWGHGRRKNFLSNLYLAVRDDNDENKFYMVTKTFKGLSDDEYRELTRELLKDKIKEEGRIVWVRPKIVVETIYDRIQKSPKYECGYALRFARVNKIRYDKSIKDADTLSRLIELYKKQFE